MSTGLRSGILLALLGAFLILRTVTQDSTGRTLVDRILGNTGGGDSATAADPNRVIAPNSLAPQMDINNARLRVQQALRLNQTPSSADVAFLKAKVPGFSLSALKANTHATLANGTNLNLSAVG